MAKNINILFTCAGRRNYLINYFKASLKGKGKVFAGDFRKDAPSLIDADTGIVMPEIDDPTYIEFLKNICVTYSIDAVISLNDLELPILSAHKEELESLGLFVIISNEKVIDVSHDKWKTYNLLVENGFNTPATYINLDKVITDLDSGKLNFPLVLKPRWGSGSINVNTVNSKEELLLVYKLQGIKLSRTILKNVLPEYENEAIVIQEKIIGIEYGMDILNDFKGNYIGCYAREKLSMRSGETDKAKSVIIEGLTDVGEKLSLVLKHVGNLDCDFFIKNSKIYVLELNPRFGGGYPFSHEAGVNTASIYVEWIKGGENISKFINYKKNILHSKCDRLIKIK